MPLERKIVLRLFAVLLCLLIGGEAHAACQVTASTPLSLGSASSYDVRAGGVARTSSFAGFRCNGSVISLLSSNYARATMTSTNNFKLARAGSSDTIPITVSADQNGTYAFSQGGTIDYMNGSLLSLLGILNGSTLEPAIFVLPTAGANVSAGTYTDTLTIQWSWLVCHGVNVLNICILSETGTGTAQVQVTLVVGADCRIATSPLSFGTAALARQFTEVSHAVAVDCTKDSTYKVAFSTGNSGAARPWRAMSDGAGHSLQYNLYRTDGTTIWDETNPQPSPTAGTGATTPGQIHSFKARINPDQSTPPAGHYGDVVSVVISF